MTLKEELKIIFIDYYNEIKENDKSFVIFWFTILFLVITFAVLVLKMF